MRNIRPVLLITCAIALFSLSCKNQQVSSNKDAKQDIIVAEGSNVSADEDFKTILFFGNSLTAGYGLDSEESFPSLIDDTLQALGYQYKVINAGLSGETTSGGLKRVDWVINQEVDIFILELGANDMLRGLPLDETRKNLEGILNSVKAKYPEAKLAICEMMAPPNMGPEYVTTFQAIYKNIADRFDATFIPFFLNGVAGNPKLLLPDGKHPNAEGQKIVAGNIWKTLEGMLGD